MRFLAVVKDVWIGEPKKYEERGCKGKGEGRAEMTRHDTNLARHDGLRARTHEAMDNYTE